MANRIEGSRVVVAVLACLGALTAFAGSAQGATFKVTEKADSGKGSLRAALAKAAKTAERDSIKLEVEGTIRVKSEFPALAAPVQIKGPGAKKLTIRLHPEADDPEFSLLRPFAGHTTVSGITISGFRGSYYGALSVGQDAELSVRSVRMIGNSAGFQGGAVGSTGIVHITKTSFDDNHADYEGGAVYAGAGATDISRSTFENNSAGAVESNGVGGALAASAPSVSVVNSTFANNQAIGQQQFGGGIAASFGNLTLSNSTLVGNSAANGANLQVHAGGGMFTSNIFSGPLVGANCQGSTQYTHSGGENLISDSSCPWDNPEAGDQVGVDPLLKPLDFYGGPTKTFALKPASPAIDAGAAADNVAVDQRGQDRTVDVGGVEDAPGSDGTDVGAYELQP